MMIETGYDVPADVFLYDVHLDLQLEKQSVVTAFSSLKIVLKIAVMSSFCLSRLKE